MTHAQYGRLTSISVRDGSRFLCLYNKLQRRMAGTSISMRCWRASQLRKQSALNDVAQLAATVIVRRCPCVPLKQTEHTKSLGGQ